MAKKEQVAFLLEKAQKEIIDELTNEEAGIIFKAIYEYEETKKEPKLEKTLRIVFKQIRKRLDTYDEAYELKCLKNKENAEKRWGKKEDANAYERMRMDANINKKEKEKENKNKNKIKNKNKLKENNSINKQIKEKNNKVSENKSQAVADSPTLDLILSFGASLGVNQEYCEKFYNHYEGIGWVNGTGQKIKNWKLVFKNWISKDQKEKNKEIKKVDEGVFKL